MLRIATFNAALEACAFCKKSDQALDPQTLIKALNGPGHPRLYQVANTIQALDADILLLNEFDYIADPQRGIRRFIDNYLGKDAYPYYYLAPVNTGVPLSADPSEVHGFGHYQGQYGMVLLSRFPVLTEQVRTFQQFCWAQMPGARQPQLDGHPYYPPEVWAELRLSSKSHWDIPLQVGRQRLHVLACHPTPPVFDGPERRNQHRNHDELRFWADYLATGRGDYIQDDAGIRGGFRGLAPFVLLGDLNADPERGEGAAGAITQLLKHEGINSGLLPVSPGGTERGRPAITADWGLRADYVLPSRRGIRVKGGGVFWPGQHQAQRALVEGPHSSDHRPVWLDMELT